MIRSVIIIIDSVCLTSYLLRQKTPPAEKIAEQHEGSEESSAFCPTENDSPLGATVLRRKDISYLANTHIFIYIAGITRTMIKFVKFI